MGVPHSKHTYVYKPKKKLRKKALHNSIFVEKPEHLIYDDVMLNNGLDDSSRYNTTKSCIDIRAVQRKKDQAARPLSMDDDMLERPVSNISNVMHQYRQEVASQIAKMAPPVSETVSSKSQESCSDGFKDVYDDDYYENNVDIGDFQDVMSYHSLDFDSVRPTEVDGAAEKLNKSVEFELERVGARKLVRKSSSRRCKVQEKPVDLAPKPAAAVPPLEMPRPAPVEPVRQLSTESALEEPVTPQEIITLEDVTAILQDIKDKILLGEINDTEVYHQLIMCKKKAQGIHVTSIKIRAKKTMLIGKINKFIHWFAISEPTAQQNESTAVPGRKGECDHSDLQGTKRDGTDEGEDLDKVKIEASPKIDPRAKFVVNALKEIGAGARKAGTKEDVKNDYHTDILDDTKEDGPKAEVEDLDEAEIEAVRDKIDAIVVDTSKDDVPGVLENIGSTKKTTNPFLTSLHYSNIEETESPAPSEHHGHLHIYENAPPIVETSNYLVQNNNTIGTTTEAEGSVVRSPVNVYEQIHNIRMLLQEVHGQMDAFTGRRYDLEYHNIIDEVFQARIMLNNVRGAQLLEDAIIEDYEKFFEDLLSYFEDLVDGNEHAFENAVEGRDGPKSVRFDEGQNSLGDSEYYVNAKNQLSFDYKSEASTDMAGPEDDGSNAQQFRSLTEYDGMVIETCETFNKTIELQEDDGDLSPDDDFIYKTNASGQIVFEHEESQRPYIVDPISFSKCRMRPLSIIQEQMDEFLDCLHQEGHKKLSTLDSGNGAGAESEDRDDWDSFDENMAKHEKADAADDDGIKEFEELERNIDNIRMGTPDLVIKGSEMDEVNRNQQLNNCVKSRNGEQFAIEPNSCRIEEGRQSKVQFADRPADFHPEADELAKYPTSENTHVNDQVVENTTTAGYNNFYSLETTSDGDHEDVYYDDSTDRNKRDALKLENRLASKREREHFADPREEQISRPPGEISPADQPGTEHTEPIFHLAKYNFDKAELESYNDIMKINLIINSLQSQIDGFSGTKSSPEYLSTFKQIFDNMRVLNTIDNCNYQEDILNLIDYTSDKIQKCIFELDLKVS